MYPPRWSLHSDVFILVRTAFPSRSLMPPSRLAATASLAPLPPGRSLARSQAELSGQKITLVSKSGGRFEIAREIAQQSKLIQNIVSTADKEGSEGGSGSGSGGSGDGGSSSAEVPVRVVEDDILAKVIQFMTYHHDKPMADIEKPIPTDNMDDIAADPFDRVREFDYNRWGADHPPCSCSCSVFFSSCNLLLITTTMMMTTMIMMAQARVPLSPHTCAMAGLR